LTLLQLKTIVRRCTPSLPSIVAYKRQEFAIDRIPKGKAFLIVPKTKCIDKAIRVDILIDDLPSFAGIFRVVDPEVPR